MKLSILITAVIAIFLLVSCKEEKNDFHVIIPNSQAHKKDYGPLTVETKFEIARSPWNKTNAPPPVINGVVNVGYSTSISHGGRKVKGYTINAGFWNTRCDKMSDGGLLKVGAIESESQPNNEKIYYETDFVTSSNSATVNALYGNNTIVSLWGSAPHNIAPFSAQFYVPQIIEFVGHTGSFEEPISKGNACHIQWNPDPANRNQVYIWMEYDGPYQQLIDSTAPPGYFSFVKVENDAAATCHISSTDLSVFPVGAKVDIRIGRGSKVITKDASDKQIEIEIITTATNTIKIVP